MLVSKLAISVQKIFEWFSENIAQCSAMIINTNIMLRVIRNWTENKTETLLYKNTGYLHLEHCPIQSTWQQYSAVPKSWEEWWEIQKSFHITTACSSSSWKRRDNAERSHPRGLHNINQYQSDKRSITRYFEWTWELEMLLMKRVNKYNYFSYSSQVNCKSHY